MQTHVTQDRQNDAHEKSMIENKVKKRRRTREREEGGGELFVLRGQQRSVEMTRMFEGWKQDDQMATLVRSLVQAYRTIASDNRMINYR